MHGPWSLEVFARVTAATGDHDRSIDCLKKVTFNSVPRGRYLHISHSHRRYSNSIRCLIPLRNDPRFKALTESSAASASQDCNKGAVSKGLGSHLKLLTSNYRSSMCRRTGRPSRRKRIRLGFNDGAGMINHGIGLLHEPKLNESLAFTGMERDPAVGTCAICGRPLSQDGRCLRCLVGLGFLERQSRT